MDGYITIEQAAEELGVAVITLRQWRYASRDGDTQKGPRSVVHARRIWYRRDEVIAYRESLIPEAVG